MFELEPQDHHELSPSLKKKINKLIADDAAQKQRTWTFYEKLRKEDPDRYWKGKTQAQMHSDATELGEAFQDGVFND